MHERHDHPLDPAQLATAVEVFGMLADATRVQLLWALVGHELSVTELATRVGKPGPAVSQHLAKLRLARLMRTRRVGTTVFYSVINSHIERLVVDGLYNAEHVHSAVPMHHRPSDEAGSDASSDQSAATR